MSTLKPSSPSIGSSPGSSRTVSPARQPSAANATSTQSRRPNRAALRDYYGLKTVAAASDASSTTSTTSPTTDRDRNGSITTTGLPISTQEEISELDKPDFSAQDYVNHILSTQNLSGVLRAESGLINEIKGLDGERKALVYDNYSKLITATETIGKMRKNMDPLTPTTSTLAPAVAYIAETTAALRERSMAAATAAVARAEKTDGRANDARGEGVEKKARQVQTVRWVLGAPKRLRRLMDDGERESAQQDWGEVKVLLKEWEGVGGVENVRTDCERIMAKA